jgi:hypothetical protein
MALSQYVLAGYFKRETKSIEAAAKYFVLGAFSSGVLLYGLSLVYGATGTLSLAGVSTARSRTQPGKRADRTVRHQERPDAELEPAALGLRRCGIGQRHGTIRAGRFPAGCRDRLKPEGLRYDSPGQRPG